MYIIEQDIRLPGDILFYKYYRLDFNIRGVTRGGVPGVIKISNTSFKKRSRYHFYKKKRIQDKSDKPYENIFKPFSLISLYSDCS